jgi:heme/copper-type cytochrome/quinol oxidase subunit 4
MKILIFVLCLLASYVIYYIYCMLLYTQFKKMDNKEKGKYEFLFSLSTKILAILLVTASIFISFS